MSGKNYLSFSVGLCANVSPETARGSTVSVSNAGERIKFADLGFLVSVGNFGKVLIKEERVMNKTAKTFGLVALTSVMAIGATLPSAVARGDMDNSVIVQCKGCKGCKGCNGCNPCAVKCGGCNPCAAAKCHPCHGCNPCAAKHCHPCGGDKNGHGCNGCNPCAAKKCNPCKGHN